MEDVAHQVKQNFRFLCDYDDGFSDFSEKERITWGKAWLKENKTKYAPESMDIIRAKIANLAFSSNISQSLPFPDEDVHAHIWSEFFPNDNWNPENISSVIQESSNSNQTNLDMRLFRSWKRNGLRVGAPKRIWLIARMGSTKTTAITSIQRVKDERKKMRKYLTEQNNLQILRKSSFPIHDKLVFVKQVGGLEAEAWQWDQNKRSFKKVS